MHWIYLFGDIALALWAFMRIRGLPARRHDRCLKRIADLETELPEHGPPWWYYKTEEKMIDYGHYQKVYTVATFDDQMEVITSTNPNSILSYHNRQRQLNDRHQQLQVQLIQHQQRIQSLQFETERPKRLREKGVWLPGDPKETNERETGKRSPPKQDQSQSSTASTSS